MIIMILAGKEGIETSSQSLVIIDFTAPTVFRVI